MATAFCVVYVAVVAILYAQLAFRRTGNAWIFTIAEGRIPGDSDDLGRVGARATSVVWSVGGVGFLALSYAIGELAGDFAERHRLALGLLYLPGLLMVVLSGWLWAFMSPSFLVPRRYQQHPGYIAWRAER